MSRYSSFLALVLMVPLGMSQFLLAQSDNGPAGQSTTAPGTMSNHHQLLITGCLKRGSEAGLYLIGDENGRTWKVVSQQVDLAGQVFHTVRITAKEVADSHPEPAPARPDDAVKGANPSITLRVITLEELSPSCTR